MRNKLENLSFILLAFGIAIGVLALGLLNSEMARTNGLTFYQQVLPFSFLAGFANFVGLLTYSTSICIPVKKEIEINQLVPIQEIQEEEENYVDTTSTHLRLQKQFG